MIARCLNSVINQTYDNWEAIVIDNCSTDNTDEILKSLADSRIKVLKIQNEGSIGKSRNLAIKNAAGEWVAFLDSDDLWTPEKLEICRRNINKDIDLIYHDFDFERKGLKRFKKRVKSWTLKKPVLTDLLVKGNAIVNSSVLVRRDLFEKIGFINEKASVNPAVDFNTWLRIAEITDNFLYVPQALGTYFVHENNVSGREMSVPFNAATSDFLHNLPKRDIKFVESQSKYMRGRFNYLNKNYEESMQDLKQCVFLPGMSRRINASVMLLLMVVKRLRVKAHSNN